MPTWIMDIPISAYRVIIYNTGGSESQQLITRQGTPRGIRLRAPITLSQSGHGLKYPDPTQHPRVTLLGTA